MLAVQYVRSVPRYLATRALGRAWSGVYTSRFSPTRLVEIEPPALPGPAWARVRPLLSGICGSDIATITARGSPYFAPLTSTPFVFGHEIVAEVVETGPEVDAVAVGDRVVVSPPLHCTVRGIERRCPACRAGETGHCRNIDRGVIAAGLQTGYCRDTGGGWSHSLVAHQVQLHRVPAGMGEESAVLIEPLACCLHAVERARVPEPGIALVIGCGTIGLLTITALRTTRPDCRVVAVAKYPHQRRFAMALGADETVTPGGELRDRLGGLLDASLHQPEIGPPTAIGGADVAFDCVATGATLDDAMRFTRARGAVIVVGMPGVPHGIDWTAMWHKELDVRGSYTAPETTFARAVQLAGELEGELRPLVGATFPLTEWTEAIECALESGERGVIKVALQP